jgi:hypothetical protein
LEAPLSLQISHCGSGCVQQCTKNRNNKRSKQQQRNNTNAPTHRNEKRKEENSSHLFDWPLVAITVKIYYSDMKTKSRNQIAKEFSSLQLIFSRCIAILVALRFSLMCVSQKGGWFATTPCNKQCMNKPKRCFKQFSSKRNFPSDDDWDPATSGQNDSHPEQTQHRPLYYLFLWTFWMKYAYANWIPLQVSDCSIWSC